MIIRGWDAFDVLSCDVDDVLHDSDLVDHLAEFSVVLLVELVVVADDMLCADEVAFDHVFSVIDLHLNGLDVPQEHSPECRGTAEESQEAVAHLLILGDELGVRCVVLVGDVVEGLGEALDHLGNFRVLASLDVLEHPVDDGVEATECFRTVGRDDQRVLEHQFVGLGCFCFGLRRGIAPQHVFADHLLASLGRPGQLGQFASLDVGNGCELHAHFSPYWEGVYLGDLMLRVR